ncbi:zinc-dependent alcohol dehydrogenase family protein [Nonomuraea endophytica]|uniref:Alcohol dehydrogenase n=1 Tax=Nonomuraea endophytica TaxID=714136 RepID=A0A7W8EG16_9ACTN|nr:zinc-dependent alcohol dehydrogenase family protein [Nonomuraea endophytica]MBB5078008.1 alcohol dehydrogenase [Nonomuraea endophytica]
MRAVAFDIFGGELDLRELPDPTPTPYGAVIRVEATGLCRSDWHGWQGHDPDITAFPHIPGHELAGVVVATGSLVRDWSEGARVTVPFICACGSCTACASGDQQVCERQTQPGFTHWGSFAEYVAIDHADVNLIAVPEDMDFTTAAGLGCRFATSFRAITEVGDVRPGEWVAVHGCGGVGLSAIMIATAAGARVVAVDISTDALHLAERAGATHFVNASAGDAAAQVRELTRGGAHVSLDALGSPATCAASVESLRRRGRHVQVGLLPGAATPIPMGRVIAHELSLLGSHGMAAHAYPRMLELIRAGILHPDQLVTRTIGLADAGKALAAIGSVPGVTMIVP